MKKVSLFFTLLLGAMVCFTSCSDDDELTPEEQEAKQKEELLVTITANYDAVTSKKWELKEFQPSADMQAAAATEDGAVAATIIARTSFAHNFNMVMSFSAEGDAFKPKVDFNLTDEEIDEQLMAYQNELYPDMADWGVFVLGKEVTLAEFRRVVAAPLAADELGIDDITNDETGLCIFSFEIRDYTQLSYDDMILAQNKLIAGNDDKIYLNEDGTLTIEATSTEFGVSKYIYNEVTE